MKRCLFSLCLIALVGCAQVAEPVVSSTEAPVWLKAVDWKTVAPVPIDQTPVEVPAPAIKPADIIPPMPAVESSPAPKWEDEKRALTEDVTAQAGALEQQLLEAQEEAKAAKKKLKECQDAQPKSKFTGCKIVVAPFDCPHCDQAIADLKRDGEALGWKIGKSEANHFWIVVGDKGAFPRFEYSVDGHPCGLLEGYDGSAKHLHELFVKHPKWKDIKDRPTSSARGKSGQGMASISDPPSVPAYDATAIEGIRDEIQSLRSELKEARRVRGEYGDCSGGNSYGASCSGSYGAGCSGGYTASNCSGSGGSSYAVPVVTAVYSSSCGGASYNGGYRGYGGASCGGGYSYSSAPYAPYSGGWGVGANVGGFGVGFGGGSMYCDPSTGICYGR